MNGANYDIAVNLDGFEGEIDAPLPGIPFAEGWHPMNLDYPTDLGLHSDALTVTTPAMIRARVIEPARECQSHLRASELDIPAPTART